MTVTVAIPSYNRPSALSVCLAACVSLSPPADEICVCLRGDDEASIRIARAAGVRVVRVDSPGHLPPLVAAVDAVRTDVLAVIDDDAVPPLDWLAGVDLWFQDDTVAAVGGPVRNHPSVTPGPLPRRPGRLAWYGGIQRNAGPDEAAAPYETCYLSGGNVAYRLSALLVAGFDPLLNRGSAVHYEADVGLTLGRRGRLIFDPKMVVDHYPAKREGAPHRSDSLAYVLDHTYSQFYIVSKHLPIWRRAMFVVVMSLVGQRSSPGILRLRTLAAQLECQAAPLFRRLSDEKRRAWCEGRKNRKRAT